LAGWARNMNENDCFDDGFCPFELYNFAEKVNNRNANPIAILQGKKNLFPYFSPDSQYLELPPLLYSLKTENPQLLLSAYNPTFSPNSKKILNVDVDSDTNSIKIYDLEKLDRADQYPSITLPVEGAYNAIFSPNSHLLAFTQDEKKVTKTAHFFNLFTEKSYNENYTYIYNIESSEPTLLAKTPAYAFVFSPDSTKIVTTGSPSGSKLTLKMYDIQSLIDAPYGKPMATFWSKMHPYIFSPDSKFFTTSTELYNIKTGERVKYSQDISAAYFSSDSKLVITSTPDEQTTIKDLKSNTTLLKVQGIFAALDEQNNL